MGPGIMPLRGNRLDLHGLVRGGNRSLLLPALHPIRGKNRRSNFLLSLQKDKTAEDWETPGVPTPQRTHLQEEQFLPRMPRTVSAG